MHIDRPRINRQWTRDLPASLTPEQVYELHELSKLTNRTIRWIVTTAVTAALHDAREAVSKAA